MPILNSIASWLIKKRMHQIDLFRKYPLEVQEEWLRKLLKSAKDTDWGKKYNFSEITNYEQFKFALPLQDYETHKPYIERIRRGEQNLLWPSEIKWFAKSAGTSNDKSKFIPVSRESLDGCHYNAGRDMVAIHCTNNPETQLFMGKNLALGGSHYTDLFDNYESYHGDVSAIIIKNLPMWAEYFRAPDVNIALINKWEDKLEKLAMATMQENVSSMAGVPSWMLVLMKRIMEIKGTTRITDVWPNLEVYFHGGVCFAPYKKQFEEMFGAKQVDFLQLYNASEGFFGIQDEKVSDEMLLMLDYGMFYEFIPVDHLDEADHYVCDLSQVKKNINYAVVISTNAGLWRYQLGDTIRFTNTDPFRFIITGRTSQFINVFGEELMIENVEKALKLCADKTHSTITEFTVAPIFMSETSGGHEWLIEFEKEPENMEYFTDLLDKFLKELNSDYEAKRYNDYVIHAPTVKKLPTGTFYNWLKSKNKLGGQHKVPRLSNERKNVEEILRMLGK